MFEKLRNFLLREKNKTNFLLDIPDSELIVNPNKYAPNSSYSFKGGRISVGGYQSFGYDTQKRIIIYDKSDVKIRGKIKNFLKIIKLGRFKGKTVLDLGGNNGLFSIISLLNGARSAHVIDIDKQAIANVKRFSVESGISCLYGSESNIKDVSEKADIVIALALVHWIFNLTTGFGSLKSAIRFLREVANSALIVEWVDPLDPAILSFKHTAVGGNQVAADSYDEESFKREIGECFDELRLIGSITPTRRLYVAFDRDFLLDLDWDQLLYEGKFVKSSKCLVDDPGGNPIYSRVYILEDKVVKQCSLLTGRNERDLLSSLEHPAIPKMLNYREIGSVSIIDLEKMPGCSIEDLLRNSPECNLSDFKLIALGLKGVVEYLSSCNVSHRDINPANVLWCSKLKKLSLVDFGWSRRPGIHQIFTPRKLGSTENFSGFIDPSLPKSDYYAASAVLSSFPKNECIDKVISEMLIAAISENPGLAASFLASIQRIKKE